MNQKSQNKFISNKETELTIASRKQPAYGFTGEFYKPLWEKLTNSLISLPANRSRGNTL